MAGKPIYGVGLDTGSRATRVVITLVEQGRVRLLGIGAAESQGWLKGRIAEPRAVTDSVRAALRQAEAAAGASVEGAVVGIGGKAIRGANTRGVVDLGYVREIDQRDVN